MVATLQNKARDQVLNSLNQILKERQQKLEESKKETKFLPHFLFVIDEPKYIMDHSIMEYLNGKGERLSFSIIYTSYLRANLPDYIDTILLLEHAREGRLLLKEKEYRDEIIQLPKIGDINLELFARDLGVLNHLLGTTSHIPESITFFDGRCIFSAIRQKKDGVHIVRRSHWRYHWEYGRLMILSN